jgi:hypothetical protein
MADRLDIVELGEAGLGDHLERLAGRIRQEVKVEPAHESAPAVGATVVSATQHLGLWKTMGKSLAEGSGLFQEKDSSPFFGIDPQFNKE